MSGRKRLKSVEIKVPNSVKVTVNGLNRKSEIESEIKALERTNKWFRTQIEPHDCGWMYTTIDGIKHRISDLRKKLRKQNGK